MNTIDKLRSFAESREADHVLIRDGLSYGDVREALRELAAARGVIENLRSEWRIQNAAIADQHDAIAAAREERDRLLKYALSMRAAIHAFGVDGGCLPEFDRDYPNECAAREEPAP